MLNLEEIQTELEELKKARKEGLPIAGWRRKALKLFKALCNGNKEKSPYEAAKSLSKRLAFDCRAELEKYFINFGFNDEGEKDKWQEMSNHLRMIYSS
ncbi:MAG: hypothetical protein SCARUB_00750 [Candidatus Scalindua rubra]|uniref:Uncharacterized protein n=1 Tax=Candidatus Scalindua rubra TaxID=1872076 RepID=A0A1E3XEK8_9BACT|nr:MAG: hypothetical protein SCARUB_00750 [Candidatus Scalindua rubra]